MRPRVITAALLLSSFSLLALPPGAEGLPLIIIIPALAAAVVVGPLLIGVGPFFLLVLVAGPILFVPLLIALFPTIVNGIIYIRELKNKIGKDKDKHPMVKHVYHHAVSGYGGGGGTDYHHQKHASWR